MSTLPQIIGRLVLPAAAIIVLILGAGAALEIENRSYTGYRVNRERRVQRVDDGGPAANGGLRTGDVITSVNGMPATDQQGWRELQRRAPAAGTWRMEVERDGKTVTLEISPTHLPASDLRLARARSLLGAIFLGVTFWAWLKSSHSAALLLAIFGLSFAFLFMGAPTFESPVVRSVLDGMGILALYVGITALVHFLLAFPSRHRALDRRWAEVVLYIPAAITVLVSVVTLTLPSAVAFRNVLGLLSLLFGGLYFLSAIVLLIWRYGAASRPDRSRHGLGLMLAGALAAFAPLALYPVMTALWPGIASYYQIIASPYSPPLTLALIPIALSVAAVRSARSEKGVRSSDPFDNVVTTGER